ncbi:hypothetical protein BDZ90DRAFT_234199 [Jaminaea rosea]|uniref:25S rRNA (uridine-N(3))-methyltransferase BMT5-like domain-containing protein n=1 Tax=Jaminaea rosea TaxID=1569628 RepID=A0A316UQD9_9BASI|nr:hypothetical protein BDZ90DRAFT_234199 [Jaminaea rosea]PWN25355.1 hypothetical protein BDZ90DRAFT_234199 [Jaminaea rosea]
MAPPPKKRKANLANALASHNQRKAEKAHQVKVDEAVKRKKISAAGGGAKKVKANDGNVRGKGKEEGSRQAIQRLLAEDQDSNSAMGATSPASGSIASSSRSNHPFHPLDTILLLGEGDFSFTLSLATHPIHPHSPSRIVATSFEPSLSSLKAKYPQTAPRNVEKLESLGVTLRFGVDAAAPLRDVLIKKWCDPSGPTKGFTKVWWGFPHAGGGEKDEARNVAANQLMLCRAFVGLRGVMRRGGKRPRYARKGVKGKGKGPKQPQGDEEEDAEDADFPLSDEDEDEPTAFSGTSTSAYPPRPLPPSHLASSLLITLRPVKPYTLWSLPQLGSHRLADLYPLVLHNAPALPRGAPRNPTIVEIKDAERNGGNWEVWRSVEFRPGDWEGYRHVTTSGGREAHDKGGGGRGSGLLDGDEETGKGSAECRTWEFGLSGTAQ